MTLTHSLTSLGHIPVAYLLAPPASMATPRKTNPKTTFLEPITAAAISVSCQEVKSSDSSSRTWTPILQKRILSIIKSLFPKTPQWNHEPAQTSTSPSYARMTAS